MVAVSMVKAELPTSYKTHFFSMEVNLMFIRLEPFLLLVFHSEMML